MNRDFHQGPPPEANVAELKQKDLDQQAKREAQQNLADIKSMRDRERNWENHQLEKKFTIAERAAMKEALAQSGREEILERARIAPTEKEAAEIRMKQPGPVTAKNLNLMLPERHRPLQDRQELLAKAKEDLRRIIAQAEGKEVFLSQEPTSDFKAETAEAQPSWSFERDNGWDALAYIASYSDLDRPQLDKLWLRMETGQLLPEDLNLLVLREGKSNDIGDSQAAVQKWKDMLAAGIEVPTSQLNALKREVWLSYIKDHSSLVVTSERMLQAELQGYLRGSGLENKTAEVFLSAKEAENKAEYQRLIELLQSYQPDLHLPDYEQAVNQPDSAINQAQRNSFGIRRQGEGLSDPLLLELWDRYHMLVTTGEIIDDVRHSVQEAKPVKPKAPHLEPVASPVPRLPEAESTEIYDIRKPKQREDDGDHQVQAG